MILLVDDDKILVLTVSHMLKQNQYDVVTMDSGNSAIEWLQKGKKCNLIITDIHMRNGLGIDLITWQKVNRSDIPVVIITGDELADLHEMEQFCEIMDLPIIQKPFSAEKLLGVMKEYYHCDLSSIAS